ncbi:vWA domain-containing protein [Vibrio crassostreae]|uniref:vWA domain-containing protein n=1 Tax=Vibrio crassostreae TaxID=246167 RepID=UPI001B30366B|nr:VWA domain-containing protein [Vibrio crassostreae]
MIEFANPLWFAATPLPYLVYKSVPAFQTKRSAIKAPFFSMLLAATDQTPQDGAVRLKGSLWQRLLIIFSWLLIVVSMAKPMWLGEIQTRELSGRDVMFVLDLSGSMAEEDFVYSDGTKSNRLDAAKVVLKDFVKDRKGDRFGLILFGDNAYLQSPFTADYEAWIGLLDEADVAMAGQSTHLGDAIGLAIKVFTSEEKSEQADKVAIILTDGNDTDSLVPPQDAAVVAASKGVKLHMVAMGDPLTTGEQSLDMEIIEGVSRITGGKSFQALSPAELRSAYEKISELEPELYESQSYQPKVSMHHLPIQVLLFVYLIIVGSLSIKKTIRKGVRRD